VGGYARGYSIPIYIPLGPFNNYVTHFLVLKTPMPVGIPKHYPESAFTYFDLIG
jgi:hypothetical protein